MSLFSGELVRLGALLPEHMTSLAEWENDADVQRLIDGRPIRPQTPTQRDEFYKNVSKEHNYPFAIFTLEDGRLIGQGGILWPDVKNRSGRLPVVISDPQSRGKGYGTDVIRILVNYAFCELNFNRLEIDLLAFNEAGVRAYEKAGFVRELTRRQAVFRDGAYQDSYLLAILRRDWKAK